MELDELLGVLRRVRTDKSYGKQSYDFYHACLERLNNLTVERNSQVRKPQMLKILDELNHYRPKDEDIAERQRKQ